MKEASKPTISEDREFSRSPSTFMTTYNRNIDYHPSLHSKDRNTDFFGEPINLAV